MASGAIREDEPSGDSSSVVEGEFHTGSPAVGCAPEGAFDHWPQRQSEPHLHLTRVQEGLQRSGCCVLVISFTPLLG
jgi:hypothetical protein